MSSCSGRCGRPSRTGRQGDFSFNVVVSIIDGYLRGNRWSNRDQVSIRNGSGLDNVLLRQREWNHHEQKGIKRRSDKLRLNESRILFFHKLAFARGENLFSSGGYQNVEGFFYDI